MKKQILTLIIGILIGGIITASVFLIIKPKSSRGTPDFSQFNRDDSGFTRRSRDNTSDGTKVEEKTVEDTKDEKQN